MIFHQQIEDLFEAEDSDERNDEIESLRGQLASYCKLLQLFYKNSLVNNE